MIHPKKCNEDEHFCTNTFKCSSRYFVCRAWVSECFSFGEFVWFKWNYVRTFFHIESIELLILNLFFFFCCCCGFSSNLMMMRPCDNAKWRTKSQSKLKTFREFSTFAINTENACKLQVVSILSTYQQHSNMLIWTLRFDLIESRLATYVRQRCDDVQQHSVKCNCLQAQNQSAIQTHKRTQSCDSRFGKKKKYIRNSSPVLLQCCERSCTKNVR